MRISNTLQLGYTDLGLTARVTAVNISKRKKAKKAQPQFDEDGVLIVNPENVERSIRRARIQVVDMAQLNEFKFFGTITINSEWHDINNPLAILDKLLHFFNNYKSRKAPDFSYLLVPEYGEKNSRLHFHFLIIGIPEADLFKNEYKYLDWRPIRERFGHVQITRIKDTKNDRLAVARYCSKYMTKDNIQLRSHRYFASKNLKRPKRESIASPAIALSACKWLQDNGFDAYSHNRRGKAFSIHALVFRDLKAYIENLIEKAKKKCRLLLLPDNTPSPFD